ncbi:MAG TPA: hypothetical protein VGY13_08650 [Solirubrobacteraceae bacterium]|jgi:hypothetical protein|nr:hypothetical protein [Solirubrobacteraceae bacterium]
MKAALACLLASAAGCALMASQATAYKMNLSTSEGHIGYIYVDGGEGVFGYLEYAYTTSDSLRLNAIAGGTLATAALATPGTTFEGFHTGSGQSCNSPGEPAGIVQTQPTTLELGYIDAKKKEVGIEERPTTGTLYEEFTCGENTVQVRGAHIGRIGPANKTIKAGGALTDENAIAPGTEHDAITHFEGGPETVLEVQVNGAGFHATPFEDPGKISIEGATLEVKAGGKKLPLFEIKEPKKKGK